MLHFEFIFSINCSIGNGSRYVRMFVYTNIRTLGWILRINHAPFKCVGQSKISGITRKKSEIYSRTDNGQAKSCFFIIILVYSTV